MAFDFEKLKIKPKEHFWVSGLKRAFELTGLLPLYIHVFKNLEHLESGKDYEWNNGNATIVYALNKEKDSILLITGWVGMLFIY